MAIYGQDILTGSLPTVGQSSWGGPLNGHLQTIFDVLEQKVTPASLLINDTVDLDANALDNVGRAIFNNLSSNPSDPRCVFWKSNDFYLRDGAGNIIQVTSGGTLNASLLAGFSGDLGTGGSAATYASANSRFTFTSSPGVAAGIQAGPLLLQNGSDSNTTTVQSLSGLTGSYTITLPPGTPTATSLLQMDNAGVLTNTRNPSLDSVTGSMVQGTRDVIGGNFLTSGSYRQSSKIRHVSPLQGAWASGGSFSSTTGIPIGTVGDVFFLPIDTREGHKITRIDVWVTPGGAGCGVTASLTAITASSTTSANSLALGPSVGTNTQAIVLTGSSGLIPVATSASITFTVKCTFVGSSNNFVKGLDVYEEVP